MGSAAWHVWVSNGCRAWAHLWRSGVLLCLLVYHIIPISTYLSASLIPPGFLARPSVPTTTVPERGSQADSAWWVDHPSSAIHLYNNTQTARGSQIVGEIKHKRGSSTHSAIPHQVLRTYAVYYICRWVRSTYCVALDYAISSPEMVLFPP